ncbi:G-PROTEIN-RECEP-F1-2 domain-containing protein [Aphelenchoides bicaudatus]|nr:G-PROTEIN-RECEP-F1-2 domain-containing protein [Aphelenchoides bicaudatus]
MDVRSPLTGHSNLTVCPLAQPPLSENYVHFSQLVNGFLTSMCVLLGTFGNLHSVKTVHFANFDKNRGVVLAVSILFLAFWDTVLLWFAFLYYGFKNLARAPQSDFVNLTTPYMHGLSQIANTASVRIISSVSKYIGPLLQIWCVVSITIQRTTRWLLHITSAEIKEYAGGSRTSLRRHHRVLLSSFRGDRRKSSLSLLYCSMYRRHFKLPIIISFVAILINVPAFFEIRTESCLRYAENRIGYMLRISPLRLDPRYRLWYKVVFRMIVTTCGPNICILLLTIRTVMLLRGSNRSRKNLFQMSESLIDRYSSKATMLTLISIMLVVKFLTFRSLSFMLDIWEQVIGFGNQLHTIIYLVDISNFLILLNSATNCFIIFRFSKWLQQKIVQRNTLKREKQVCVEANCFNSVERINMLHTSWQQMLFVTHHQVGARVLYSMVLANPQVFALFREVSRAQQTGTPVNINHSQFRGNRDRKVVRIASARLDSLSTIQTDSEHQQNHADRLRHHESNSIRSVGDAPSHLSRKLTAPVHTDSVQDLMVPNKRRDTVDMVSRSQPPPIANILPADSQNSLNSKAASDYSPKLQGPLINPAFKRIGVGCPLDRKAMSAPNTPKDRDPLLDSESANFDATDSVFDLQATPPGQENKTVCPFDIEQSPVNLTNNLFDACKEEQTADAGTPPTIPPEQLRRMSMELVSNKMFREIGDRITGFLGAIIESMYNGQSEQQVISKIRVVADLHYEKNIIIPPNSWRDFKLCIMNLLSQCEFATQSERSIAIDAWSSLLAIFIREFKLSMLGKAEHTLTHKHSTSTTPAFDRAASSNTMGRMD